MTSRTLTRRSFLTNPFASVLPAAPSAIPYTPTESFYAEPRTSVLQLDAVRWQLGIWRDGARCSFTFADLQSFPTHTLDATLCNIAVHHASNLIGHARWRGVLLRDLVPELTQEPLFARVMGMNGLSSMLTPSELERALVAFTMNDAPLSPKQGYPARLIVPGAYDFKMPRWIARIELSHEPLLGYWEDQGLINGQVRTFSRFTQPLNSQSVSPAVILSGLAYAGLRRIASVEISVDDSDWMPVTIGASEPGCWTTWTADWYAPMMGSYTIAVRAIDEQGRIQHDPQRLVLHVDTP